MSAKKRLKFLWWRVEARLPWRERVDLDAILAEAERVTPIRQCAVTIRVGCPTPRKRAFTSRSAARAAIASKANKGSRMRAYRCPCGSYHLARRDVAAGRRAA